ncbi:uncharacterized protein Z520_03849 [Fonsecaea multimorphosa CBS 102226]|uniref:A to I editase domain-containing protein n=1 Tax=Fonsecaea multimorphosa CBS 102226 TaxID=1442371 RepID=A0A0D2KTS2_9EURO|nr:uncharacterized protein Z520_03849 [Fonsecaea multimorphosa CBS 102226]KIY00164.1 hypothetical protein Z520_03849 [Fonsecaea multimorphosa CBS 102226]OAL27358.1 hypothetical protein AYO22_03633 [Fonsecaea multimorphosa]
MNPIAERVAQLALSTFNSLPPKCKPRTLPDGTTEWTPMSAVVLAREGQGVPPLTCVSLATGTKCLPASALPRCKGFVVHDSHAEILALRGFNRWLLSELEAVLGDPDYKSPYLEFSPRDEAGVSVGGPFRLKDNVTIYFFTTEAPCGDASMEILMESFPAGDTSPWSVDSNTATPLQGRGYFSLLGYVRRKPARGDAEPSGSKSCSDKLAVKQFTSVLSFPADLFVERTANAYIKSIVVFADQYHPVGYQRAFGPEGRLSPLKDAATFFTIERLPANFARFAFERRLPTSASSMQVKSKTSNISALWVQAAGTNRANVVEVLINGVKQGYRQWDDRSAKASMVSRMELWTIGLRISKLLEHVDVFDARNGVPGQSDINWCKMIRSTLSASTYEEAESSTLRMVHKKCKNHVTDTLDNWTKNAGDSDWSCIPPDRLPRTPLERGCSAQSSQSLFNEKGSPSLP